MNSQKCKEILQKIIQSLEQLQNGLELGYTDDNQIMSDLIQKMESLITGYKNSGCINTETRPLIERIEFLIKALKHFFQIKKMNIPFFANDRALEVYILIEIKFLIEEIKKQIQTNE